MIIQPNSQLFSITADPGGDIVVTGITGLTKTYINNWSADITLDIDGDSVIVPPGYMTTVFYDGANFTYSFISGGGGSLIATSIRSLGDIYENGNTLSSLYLGINDNAVSATTAGSATTANTATTAGSATTATKLATSRTISLSGEVEGSASFDGSANATISATLNKSPVITLSGAVTGSATMTDLGNVTIATTATSDPKLTLSGDASGSATFTNLGNATLSVTVANDSHTHDTRYYTESESDGRFLKLTGGQITGSQTIGGWRVRNIYVSTSNPSGGNDGDVWFKY